MKCGPQTNMPKETLQSLLSIIQNKFLHSSNYDKYLVSSQINMFMAEIYYMAKRDSDAMDKDLVPSTDIVQASLVLVLLIRDLSQPLDAKAKEEIKCFYSKIIKVLSKLDDNFESTKKHLQKKITNGSITYVDRRDDYKGHYIKEPISGCWSDSGTLNEVRSAEIYNCEELLSSSPRTLGFSKRFKQSLSKLPFVVTKERPARKTNKQQVRLSFISEP